MKALISIELYTKSYHKTKLVIHLLTQIIQNFYKKSKGHNKPTLKILLRYTIFFQLLNQSFNKTDKNKRPLECRLNREHYCPTLYLTPLNFIKSHAKTS